MIRIGSGYDVHQLVEKRPLILGGVEIKSDKGLLGHSDADALSHAIGDALLGSLALGDLGTHFPDTDERFAGISSLILLKEIGLMLLHKGYEIANIDSTVVLESPKLAPHIKEIRRKIAASLSILESQVSVKATTSEAMGFVGQGEGIAVYASVLVTKVEAQG